MENGGLLITLFGPSSLVFAAAGFFKTDPTHFYPPPSKNNHYALFQDSTYFGLKVSLVTFNDV